MACDGVSGGSMGIHLGGHGTQIFRNDADDVKDDGAFITYNANGTTNEYAAGLSPEFRDATDKKPGGIFT